MVIINFYYMVKINFDHMVKTNFDYMFKPPLTKGPGGFLASVSHAAMASMSPRSRAT